MKRNQKGITLVALVVTIIVLLILAGISISLVAGGQGILNRASKTANTDREATAKEQVTLMFADYHGEYYEALYVKNSLTVNTKLGDYIYTEHATGTTPDSYKYEITLPAGKSAITDMADTDKYIITIYGSNASASNVDKRLSKNITGTIARDGKLTWDF